MSLLLSPGTRGGSPLQAADCIPAIGTSQTQQPLPVNDHMQAAAVADAGDDQSAQQAPQQRQSLLAEAMLQPSGWQPGHSKPCCGMAIPAESKLKQADTSAVLPPAGNKALPAKMNLKHGVRDSAHQTEPTAVEQAAAKQAVSAVNRWPGSGSQGALADANDVHGVAAVVVRARRSKSCSGNTTTRQHAAKKLIFQQLTLARKAVAGAEGKAVQSAMNACHLDSTPCKSHPPSEAVNRGLGMSGSSHPQSFHAGPATGAASEAVPSSGAVAQQLSARQALTDSVPVHSEQQQHTHKDGAGQQHQRQQEDISLQQAEAGSQQQWEAAIDQLHSLAGKHSQDSEDNVGAACDPKAVGATLNTQEGATVLEIQGNRQQKAAVVQDARGKPAELAICQAGAAAASSEGVPHGQAASRQAEAASQPQPATNHVLQESEQAGQESVPPGFALSGQGGYEQTVEHAPVMLDRTEASGMVDAVQHSYTGLSRLRLVMRQRRQQPGQNKVQGQGHSLDQIPGQLQAEDQGLIPGQGQQQTLGHGPTTRQLQTPHLSQLQELGQGHVQGQGQKRKCPDKDNDMGKQQRSDAQDLTSRGQPCKRQCLQAAELAKASSLPAHSAHHTRPSWLSSSTHPQQHGSAPSKSAQQRSSAAAACLQVQPASAFPDPQDAASSIVSDPAGNNQLEPGSTLGMPAEAATAAAVVMQAAGAVTTMTRAEPPAGTGTAAARATQDRLVARASDRGSAGHEGSEGHQGGLRLDLSSEEDPLQCTQRLPSSQGAFLC